METTGHHKGATEPSSTGAALADKLAAWARGLPAEERGLLAALLRRATGEGDAGDVRGYQMAEEPSAKMLHDTATSVIRKIGG